LLKNITGLLCPSSGDIYLRGKNIKELSVCELFTDSVYKEIAFALKNKRLPKTEIKQRVEDALKIVDLKDSEAFPHACCMTDRKKIVTACVLAMGCKIIIFDEIDTGLDYQGSVNIMNIACGLHKKGFTIIFVSHNMYLVNKYAHRIILIEENDAMELSTQQRS
jgi:energy-coupling factor transport system ATP-binding protein